MTVISPVTHAHFPCCSSHYSRCWAATQAWCHMWMFPQAHTNTNLSAVVVLADKVPVTPPQKPAQLKLLFHAQLQGKLPLLSFWFKLTPTDLGSNSVYLHKNMHHTLFFGASKLKKNIFIHRNLVISRQRNGNLALMFTAVIAFICRVLFQRETLNLLRILCWWNWMSLPVFL